MFIYKDIYISISLQPERLDGKTADDELPQALPPERLDGYTAEDKPPQALPPKRRDGNTAAEKPHLKAADLAQKARPPEPLDDKTAFRGADSVLQTPLPQALASKRAKGEPLYKEWTQSGMRGRQSNLSARSPLAGRVYQELPQSGRRGLQTQATLLPCGGRVFFTAKQSAYLTPCT